MRIAVFLLLLGIGLICAKIGYTRWQHRYICLKDPAPGVPFACGPADYMDMIVAPDKITHWEIYKPRKPKP